MTIDIGTNEYLRSHGQQPKGRGKWAFAVYFPHHCRDVVFVPQMMTLTDAKDWIRAYVREAYRDVISFVNVEVAP